MKVSVFGSGYVGLVTGACLAEVGNDVVCMDVDERKIEMLKQGEIPIYEPGLEAMVERNVQAGRLTFTADAAAAVEHGLFQFIAVGTPPDEDGSADLQYVLAVATAIAEHMDDYRVIVDKSTVPVGTGDKVRERINETLRANGKQVEFDVVSNPEFLKEGAALDDFMKPDRIIIGTDNPRTTELLRALYTPFNRNHDRLIAMDIRSAELTKYAANAILATKISFMNELSNLSERLGADIEQVRHGIGADTRIGYSFIYPGCGYGGSCFPKDVNALERTAREVGYDAQLLTAVEAVNYRQKRVLFSKIQRHFSGDLKDRTFALWGLSFKPNTDDMREASSRVLMEALWEAGAKVQVFDPEAMDECRRIYGERDDLVYCEDQESTLNGADALVVVTEWQVFRSPDYDEIKQSLSEPVIFDGRNIYDPQRMKEAGFSYYAIGRGD
ncbi:MAG: UDP-glucose/GDP-mannose dehydrogenase family protein [Candidatus Thiodiazotropha sp.]|nr:UDP-glucose/GDP-mannose dehydrogenase family protein [Candidatus Thiodiazotropha sp.]MCM8883523.1 UDP-glucose/GDP-mannose dehydrogenase family protein [Candidatus Thiodiazotropha sp.]MCM8919070.1 UDP-glucose/GDP-mannose dehydrogenase family protein [Candidatus Thiodiazotropha sp.]MCU7873393.1 UDP-glucose/GDP-mannose dehydrogenase family protein [Candidatus Thiodiazotropha sp. (ex Lucinoma borealis)]